jgi:N-acetylglucosaminyl-diphospho-decaprenol L-rhamnosyltransferase
METISPLTPILTFGAVVVTYRSSSTLAECLDRLVRCGFDQIVVVDNASSDDSADIADGVRGVVVIRLSTNEGFGTGCNAGVQHLTTDVVAFVNPDLFCADGVIEAVRGQMAGKSAGVLGTPVRDRSGTLDYNTARMPGAMTLIAGALGLHTVLSSVHFPNDRTRTRGSSGPCELVHGSLMFMRRGVFHQLGGFDQRFFMYCEESDLCIRAQRAGFVNAIVEGPASVHIGGVSARSNPAATLTFWAKSRILFARKHLGVRAIGVALAIWFLEPIARIVRTPSQVKVIARAWRALYVSR